jgi:hypothetical protein
VNAAIPVTLALIVLLVFGEVRSAYRGPRARRPLWLSIASVALFVAFAFIVASRLSQFR